MQKLLLTTLLLMNLSLNISMENLPSKNGSMVKNNSDSFLNKRLRSSNEKPLEKRVKIEFMAPDPKMPVAGRLKTSPLMESPLIHSPVKNDVKIVLPNQQLISPSKESLDIKGHHKISSSSINSKTMASSNHMQSQSIQTQPSSHMQSQSIQTQPSINSTHNIMNNGTIHHQCHQNCHTMAPSINPNNNIPLVNYNQDQWDQANFNWKTNKVNSILNQMPEDILYLYEVMMHWYQTIAISGLNEEDMEKFHKKFNDLYLASRLLKDNMQKILDFIQEYLNNNNSFEIVTEYWQNQLNRINKIIVNTNKKVKENIATINKQIENASNVYKKLFITDKIRDLEQEMHYCCIIYKKSSLEKNEHSIDVNLLYQKEKRDLEANYFKLKDQLIKHEEEKQKKKDFLWSLSELLNNNIRNIQVFHCHLKNFVVSLHKKEEKIKSSISNQMNDYIIWHYPIALTDHQIKEESIENAALLIEKDLEARRGPYSFYGYTLEKNYNYSTQRFIKGMDNDNIFQDFSFYLAPILIKKEEGFNSKFTGFLENPLTLLNEKK